MTWVEDIDQVQEALEAGESLQLDALPAVRRLRERLMFFGINDTDSKENACDMIGKDVDPMLVFATSSGGYQAKCPSCEKVLWLNRQTDDGVTWRYFFPDHIGKEQTAS